MPIYELCPKCQSKGFRTVTIYAPEAIQIKSCVYCGEQDQMNGTYADMVTSRLMHNGPDVRRGKNAYGGVK